MYYEFGILVKYRREWMGAPSPTSRRTIRFEVPVVVIEAMSWDPSHCRVLSEQDRC